MTELLTAALRYASYGWKVFPCHKDKSPMTINGFKNATKDTKQIKRWWAENPDASIGCACGPESGVWVIDVDLPDGPGNWEKLIIKNGPIETLEQKTGSGGRQLFFNYNGTEIKNNTKKLGVNLDVRGFGGYSILPPSPHPSGGVYEWVKKIKPVNAPEWLYALLKEPDPIPTIAHTDKTSLYGQKALASEIINVSSAGEGTRNDTLNRAAYCIGQLVAGGCVDHGQAMNGLLGAAIAAGLKEKEARATINSGFRSGASQPRTAPENKDVWDIGAIDSQQNKQCKQSIEESADVSGCQQMSANVSGCKQDFTENLDYSPKNIAAHIKEWIVNSKGSFTTDQLDREFCLTTRQEKNNRSQVLNRLIKNSLIKRDKRINGKYLILDSNVEWLDITNVKTEAFDIILPFGLHKDVLIPPKAIIVLAGSSNAGKTAINLNILNDNIGKPYPLNYLMSEMGVAEYSSRIKNFSTGIEQWKRVKVASRSYDFDGIIQHYNQDGLTIIDYVEEVDGEYFKIPSTIRDCYDALGDGVAVISIQKKASSEFGRGGEGTVEKSRLYLSVDLIHVSEVESAKRIYCALKCIKSKHNLARNLTGSEMHFRIDKGAALTKVMDWKPSYKVDREQCRRTYATMDERPDIEPDDKSFWFRVVGTSEKVRIKQEQADKWQEHFPDLDINSELRRIMKDSETKPFLKKDNYFFSLSGILRKKSIQKIQELGL